MKILSAFEALKYYSISTAFLHEIIICQGNIYFFLLKNFIINLYIHSGNLQKNH